MTVLEIILLILGIIVFVASFLIPVTKAETSGDIRAMIQDEVKQKVAGELESIRSHVDDVVDEAVEYAQEKTERSLERISNEKIMAVNEYSDTVLAEINKNHQEVLFLYDMLNDKHDNLLNAVSEANKAQKEMEESTKEAERAVNTISQLTPNKENAFSGINDEGMSDAGNEPATAIKSGFRDIFGNVPLVSGANVVGDTVVGSKLDAGDSKTSSGTSSEKKIRTLGWAALAEAEAATADDSYIAEDRGEAATQGENPDAMNPLDYQSGLHQRILEMNKQGKSSVEIARSLDMGVGEVDLIIGLHGGR